MLALSVVYLTMVALPSCGASGPGPANSFGVSHTGASGDRTPSFGVSHTESRGITHHGSSYPFDSVELFRPNLPLNLLNL
jgi:hypothetical protein